MDEDDREMDEGAWRWLKSTAYKNYWRVVSWYDLDDLVQDGVYCYYRVVKKYPHVNERRHLMALFQRTYLGHIHDLANSRTRLNELPVSSLVLDPDKDPLDFLEHLCGPVFEHSSFMIELSEMPKPVHAVLLLYSSDEMLEKLRRPYRRYETGRETLNSRLCRLSGYNPAWINLVAWVQNYFSDGGYV